MARVPSIAPRVFALAAAFLAAFGTGTILPELAGPAPHCVFPTPGSDRARTPIHHVFFVIKENHAFENYFGDLPGVVGYPPNASLPAVVGGPATVRPFWIDGWTTPDLPHDRASDVADLDGGRNDGFVAEAAAGGAEHPSSAVGYYTADEIPAYYAYARAYLLDDEFFAGVLGPTLPNRLFDIGLTGTNWTSDTAPPAASVAGPTLPTQLEGARLPWAYYYSGAESYIAPLQVPALADDPCVRASIRPMSEFVPSLYGPDPPAVAFLDPSGDPLYSEHPPANVTLGSDWTAAVVNAIQASPLGPSSAIFVFFDENGGYWDPVPPPTTSPLGDGFRVPLLVISPWTPAHTVSNLRADPAALLRFVDDDFGLPPLTPAVGAAPPISGFFDFNASARAPVPVPTPVAV